MKDGEAKVSKLESMLQSYQRALKFNVYGAARGNLELAGIASVLRDDQAEVYFVFAGSVGVEDQIRQNCWHLSRQYFILQSSILDV